MNWFSHFKKKEQTLPDVTPKWAIDKEGNIVGYWDGFLPAEQAAMANISSFEELEVWCKNRLNMTIRYNSSLSPCDRYWFNLDNVRACMSIDHATGQVDSAKAEKPVADMCNKLMAGDVNLTFEHETIRYKGVPILWWRRIAPSGVHAWQPDFRLSDVEQVLIDYFATKFIMGWNSKKDIAKRNNVIRLFEQNA